MAINKEPVGSVAPKVSVADEITNARANNTQTLSLGCPAQSYPVPVYRWAIYNLVILSFQHILKRIWPYWHFD